MEAAEQNPDPAAPECRQKQDLLGSLKLSQV